MKHVKFTPLDSDLNDKTDLERFDVQYVSQDCVIGVILNMVHEYRVRNIHVR